MLCFFNGGSGFAKEETSESGVDGDAEISKEPESLFLLEAFKTGDTEVSCALETGGAEVSGVPETGGAEVSDVLEAEGMGISEVLDTGDEEAAGGV